MQKDFFCADSYENSGTGRDNTNNVSTVTSTIFRDILQGSRPGQERRQWGEGGGARALLAHLGS